MKGVVVHLVTGLRLNFRNRMALLYGFLFPIVYLIAFLVLYRYDRFPLVKHVGELLTVTVLGGACFGLPTAIVSERERGVWRRYRLTPLPTIAFVLSVLLARFVLVLSSGLIQVGLAMWIFKMPLPRDPWRLLGAFTLVSFAFLGIGLVIAMIAGSTHAVQALGQSVFLPMIIIGGVGVPLSQLPEWGRVVAAFLPGRYAVQAIDPTVYDVSKGPFARATIYTSFNHVALFVIGATACLAAVQLFRWENTQRPTLRAWLWGLLALGSWVAVGLWARSHKLI